MSKGVLIGWLARVVVVLLSFINTKMLIESMGVDGLAAFSIILSLTPWIALMNLGLPITIQNEISKYRSGGKKHSLLENQAFGTMLIIGLSLFPFIYLISYIMFQYFLTEYTFLSQWSVGLIISFMYISSLSQLFPQIMYANNNPFWPNIYPLFGSVWTLLSLIFIRILSINDINLILIIISISNLLMPLHALFKLKVISNIEIKLKEVICQIKKSKDMLIFGIMATSILSVDYFIMSRLFAPIDIVSYNIASKLFMTFLIFHGVMIAVNWSLVSEKINIRKRNLAKKAVENLLKQGMTLAIIFGLILSLGMNFIVIYLTNGDIKFIPLEITLAFFVYVIVRVWTDTFAMALQSSGRVNEINKILPFQAIISAGLQYYLSGKYGVAGISFGVTISFVLTVAWIIPFKFYKMINEFKFY